MLFATISNKSACVKSYKHFTYTLMMVLLFLTTTKILFKIDNTNCFIYIFESDDVIKI